MLSFMKTLCHKIHMELQLRAAEAQPRHTLGCALLSDCPPAFTHKDRTCLSDIKRALKYICVLPQCHESAVFAGHVTIPVSGLKCSTPSNPILVDSVNGLSIISFILPS